jgi:hypothetical protein
LIANPDNPVSDEDHINWTTWAGVDDLAEFDGTRGELLNNLYQRIQDVPSEALADIYSE